MSLKVSVYLLIVVLITSACGLSMAPAATSIPPIQENVNTVVPPQPTASVAAAPAPKHKDLTFVEFFAIT